MNSSAIVSVLLALWPVAVAQRIYAAGIANVMFYSSFYCACTIYALTRSHHIPGSGHDMLGLKVTAKEVIALTGKKNPNVLYLGTATYDNPAAMEEQTENFRSLGCRVTGLNISWTSPSPATLRAAFADKGLCGKI